MFDFFYKRPYLLYSIVAGLFILGVYGLIVMPKTCSRIVTGQP